ncbi:hypothetical protein [Kiloniella sp.]|uniref:hypothetical protein n=1 Tax=Kiloniella sp. TaxID=1938587 RepID=UPI003B0210A1
MNSTRENGFSDDIHEPLRHDGAHVSVSIPDTAHIKEALEELKGIQEELEKRLSSKED